MIREFTDKDMDIVLDIWLEASEKAHDFVDSDFWKSQVADMRERYLPQSETWVYEDHNGVTGFFSLMDSTLAAIFVKPSRQGHGIGKQLMGKAKSLRDSLNLCVYSKNTPSIAFYEKQGFTLEKEDSCQFTGEKESLMVFNAV